MADGGNTSGTLADQVRKLTVNALDTPLDNPEKTDTAPQFVKSDNQRMTEGSGNTVGDQVRVQILNQLETMANPEQTHPAPQPEPSNPVLQTESDSPGACPDKAVDESIAAVIKSLEELEPQLETMDTIAEMFHNCPITCMSESTDEQMCWRLDPPSDSHSDAGYIKTYAGMAEWAELEVVFIKYLTRTESRHKTTDVLAKWSTSEGEPRPTLGNLQNCICGEGGIDRPDVITDLAHAINKDAFKWEMDKVRANTTKPGKKKDDSWQLTRHDVMTGRRTYYTCCLVYADEDERTASMITNIFMAVKKDAVFFNPQFDLKFGKYVQETTAAVIEERCAGKVIFVLSEYFFASPVCQFTVQFSKGLDIAAEQGNLIPFKLKDKIEHVPKVLLGIAAIKWYRPHSRKNYWCSLATAIFGGRLTEEQLKVLQARIVSIVENESDKYLSDPHYDSDIPEPGSPIPVYDPAPDSVNSDDPSSREFMPIESDTLVQQSGVSSKTRLTRIRHFVRKKIVYRVFRSTPRRRELQFFDEETREAFERFQAATSGSSHVRPRSENDAQILTDEDFNRLSLTKGGDTSCDTEKNSENGGQRKDCI